MRKVYCILTMLLVVGFFAQQTAHAKKFRVNSSIDQVDKNPGDGICETIDGKCTLRAAVEETNALKGGDIIFLEAGEYILDSPYGSIIITGHLILAGSGPEETVIDGNEDKRVFFIDGKNGKIKVKMKNLTITNGTDEGGAGIWNKNGRLHILNCIIKKNSAFTGSFRTGGGTYNEEDGNVKIFNSTIINNFAGGGGGIGNSGNITILDSVVVNNGAEALGSGISNLGNMIIKKCEISENDAFGDAGGIFNFP